MRKLLSVINLYAIELLLLNGMGSAHRQVIPSEKNAFINQVLDQISKVLAA